MAIINSWVNDGEPDDKGIITCQIKDDQTGAIQSSFRGKTIKEVADQLLESNRHATERLNELRSNRTPDKAPAQATVGAPRSLSVDETFRLNAELTDPNKTVAAVSEIITATTGATPETIGRLLSDQEKREQAQFWKAETNAFLEANPDYYQNKVNEERILRGLELRGLDLTRNNLEIVYDELSSQGLLIVRPDGAAEHQEQQGRQPANAGEANASRRPRLIASTTTGMRSSHSSGQRPPSESTPKYTRAQIEAMPKAEYDANALNPQFRQMVDQLYAAAPKSRPR